jgi:hypothetical protein
MVEGCVQRYKDDCWHILWKGIVSRCAAITDWLQVGLLAINAVLIYLYLVTTRRIAETGQTQVKTSQQQVEASCTGCPDVTFRAKGSSHRPNREEYQRSLQSQFDEHLSTVHVETGQSIVEWKLGMAGCRADNYLRFS